MAKRVPKQRRYVNTTRARGKPVRTDAIAPSQAKQEPVKKPIAFRSAIEEGMATALENRTAGKKEYIKKLKVYKS